MHTHHTTAQTMPLPSPKSRRHSIPDHQLVITFKARPKIAHALIQARREHIPNITVHALMRLNLQSLSEKTDYCLEALVRREFEHALGQVRGGADGLETDCYCGR
jgi:hypothetical protein